MIRVHITTDREFAPDQEIDLRNGAAIGFSGYMLLLDAEGADLQLTVASKSGATQVTFRCLEAADYRRIVEHLHPNGMPAKRLRYSSGMLNDGPGGEPALETFAPDGRLLSQARFHAGSLRDGPLGEPAMIELDHEHRVRRIERYQRGKLQDGIDGHPAVTELDEAGQVVHVAHYREGELLSEHEPAVPAATRPTRHARSRRDQRGPGVA